MNDNTFFFDTYALIEIIKGNPNYKNYTNSKIITSVFNLAELNHILKKEMSKEKADNYTKDYSPFVVKVELIDIFNAMDFKTKNHKLSIPDAIGYLIARRYGIKFLTGDGDFEYLDNVEFIKK